MPVPGFEHINGLTEQVRAKNDRFVQMVSRHNPYQPCPGARIAQMLGITRPQVAALRKYCWERGTPVASGVKGYYMAHSSEELQETIDHIEGRMKAEQANLRLLLDMKRRFLANEEQQQLTILDDEDF